MKLQSINPATGEFIESFEEISDAEREAALERAEQAFRTYRGTSFHQRAGWLNKAAHILEDEKDRWARLMTQEMGKTYKAAVAEAEKCAWASAISQKTAPAFSPTRRSRPMPKKATSATCRWGRSSR